MKLYLDDERKAPEGWIRTKTPGETIATLKTKAVRELSLDHDLGDDDGIGTGYDVLLWIEREVVNEGFDPPKIHIHTANPSARSKMLQAVSSIESWDLKNRLGER